MLTVETRLFLALAGGPAADSTVRQLLRDGANWSAVVATAKREGCGSQLSRRIRGIGGVVIDAEGQNSLRELERGAEFRMRFLQQRLTEAVDTLTTARVPVMLVRGAALGCTSYATFADLEMNDIDILVRPDTHAAAIAALERSGWARSPSMSPQRPLLLDGRAPAMGVGLAVHTEVLPGANPFAWTASDLWSRAQPVERHALGAVVPSRIDRLIYSCVDFGWGNMFRRKAWRALRDMAVIAGEGPFDWLALVDAATKARTASVCYWTLRLAHELCDLELPVDVLPRLHPGPSERVARRLTNHLVPSGDPGWLDRWWWKRAIRPT
jgi:hypothetical protein